MDKDLSSSKRLGPFLSLLFLYLLLITLTLFLSQQVLSDIARGNSLFNKALIPVVSLLPLTLLGAVAYQGFQLWRQRKQNLSGSRLKLRLTLFFSLAAILASLPQGLLSVTFIDATLRSWLLPSLNHLQETAHQLGQYRHTFHTLILFFYLMFALPIFLIAVLIGFTMGDDLIRPLINLETATRRVAEGDYTVRILTPEHDELAFLASSFNAMTSELALSRTKIQQTEKITAWQEIARQLAHEIRNPLTPIRLSAERIKRRKDSDPQHLAEVVEPAVQAILTEVQRLDILLKEFSDFARLPAPKKQKFLLSPLLESILTVYTASHPDILVHAEGLKPQIELYADRAQMGQVFTNLIKNAVEAMNGSGELFLRSSLVKKGDKTYCRVQIHDLGPGLSEEVQARAFQPYFTTKKDGTGLGLAIVERLVFDHEGTVWFESQAGYGTTFFVELPMEEACETPS